MFSLSKEGVVVDVACSLRRLLAFSDDVMIIDRDDSVIYFIDDTFSFVESTKDTAIQRMKGKFRFIDVWFLYAFVVAYLIFT